MTEGPLHASADGRTRRFPVSKFTPPRPVPRLLRRSRLFDELDRGVARSLTLLTGSPGSGKTTLLADWLGARADRPSAWLTCDAADTDPLRFLSALVEALRHNLDAPRLGESTLQLIEIDGGVSNDAVAALSDDLERIGGAPVLVIDDLHVVGNGPTANAVELVIQSRPPNVQVAIASRTDPPLRLHRMRSREDVLELRDGDLAFSMDEAKGFFSGFGLVLSDADVSRVRDRAEGWPVGLQLAALSMQATPELAGTLGRGTLHGHTVAGYFLEEVLSRQPTEVSEFMLAISILDELSVPACTAVGGNQAHQLLEYLTEAHLFVTVIDEQARTYRYHPLIREVLQEELHARDPIREKRLHEAAAVHLLDGGRAAAAARHLLESGHSPAAFRLLSDRLVHDVLTNPVTGSVLDLEEFRPDVYAGMPEVLVPLAAELLWRGAFDRGARAVALARACDVDSARDPRLAVQLALVDTLYCTYLGDFEEALSHRQAARSFEDDATGVDDWIVTLDMLAMKACTYLGDYSQARELAQRVIDAGTSVPLTEVVCPGVISQIALLEGALDEAATLADRSLTQASKLRFDHHFFAFHALRTAGQLALERRDLDGAAEPVERALDMMSGARPAFNFLAQLDRARIWAAAGNRDDAIASLPAARAALKNSRSCLLAEADELEARLRLSLGDPPGARRAASKLPLPRRVVVETIIALATGDPPAAERWLRDVPTGAQSCRAEVELLLLRANVALALSRPGWPRIARRALDVAREHGFLQLVLDTAPQLVDHVIAHPDSYHNVDELSSLMTARLESLANDGHRLQIILAPLTDSELRVLARLADGLSYADVATDLYLSLNTVKTHLRHAYMKLGVRSRSAAIARASTLGLL